MTVLLAMSDMLLRMYLLQAYECIITFSLRPLADWGMTLLALWNVID